MGLDDEGRKRPGPPVLGNPTNYVPGKKKKLREGFIADAKMANRKGSGRKPHRPPLQKVPQQTADDKAMASLDIKADLGDGSTTLLKRSKSKGIVLRTAAQDRTESLVPRSGKALPYDGCSGLPELSGSIQDNGLDDVSEPSLSMLAHHLEDNLFLSPAGVPSVSDSHSGLTSKPLVNESSTGGCNGYASVSSVMPTSHKALRHSNESTDCTSSSTNDHACKSLVTAGPCLSSDLMNFSLDDTINRESEPSRGLPTGKKTSSPPMKPPETLSSKSTQDEIPSKSAQRMIAAPIDVYAPMRDFPRVVDEDGDEVPLVIDFGAAIPSPASSVCDAPSPLPGRMADMSPSDEGATILLHKPRGVDVAGDDIPLVIDFVAAPSSPPFSVCDAPSPLPRRMADMSPSAEGATILLHKLRVGDEDGDDVPLVSDCVAAPSSSPSSVCDAPSPLPKPMAGMCPSDEGATVSLHKPRVVDGDRDEAPLLIDFGAMPSSPSSPVCDAPSPLPGRMADMSTSAESATISLDKRKSPKNVTTTKDYKVTLVKSVPLAACETGPKSRKRTSHHKKVSDNRNAYNPRDLAVPLGQKLSPVMRLTGKPRTQLGALPSLKQPSVSKLPKQLVVPEIVKLPVTTESSKEPAASRKQSMELLDLSSQTRKAIHQSSYGNILTAMKKKKRKVPIAAGAPDVVSASTTNRLQTPEKANDSCVRHSSVPEMLATLGNVDHVAPRPIASGKAKKARRSSSAEANKKPKRSHSRARHVSLPEDLMKTTEKGTRKRKGASSRALESAKRLDDNQLPSSITTDTLLLAQVQPSIDSAGGGESSRKKLGQTEPRTRFLTPIQEAVENKPLDVGCSSMSASSDDISPPLSSEAIRSVIAPQFHSDELESEIPSGLVGSHLGIENPVEETSADVVTSSVPVSVHTVSPSSQSMTVLNETKKLNKVALPSTQADTEYPKDIVTGSVVGNFPVAKNTLQNDDILSEKSCETGDTSSIRVGTSYRNAPPSETDQLSVISLPSKPVEDLEQSSLGSAHVSVQHSVKPRSPAAPGTVQVTEGSHQNKDIQADKDTENGPTTKDNGSLSTPTKPSEVMQVPSLDSIDIFHPIVEPLSIVPDSATVIEMFSYEDIDMELEGDSPISQGSVYDEDKEDHQDDLPDITNDTVCTPERKHVSVELGDFIVLSPGPVLQIPPTPDVVVVEDVMPSTPFRAPAVVNNHYSGQYGKAPRTENGPLLAAIAVHTPPTWPPPLDLSNRNKHLVGIRRVFREKHASGQAVRDVLTSTGAASTTLGQSTLIEALLSDQPMVASAPQPLHETRTVRPMHSNTTCAAAATRLDTSRVHQHGSDRLPPSYSVHQQSVPSQTVQGTQHRATQQQWVPPQLAHSFPSAGNHMRGGRPAPPAPNVSAAALPPSERLPPDLSRFSPSSSQTSRITTNLEYPTEVTNTMEAPPTMTPLTRYTFSGQGISPNQQQTQQLQAQQLQTRKLVQQLLTQPVQQPQQQLQTQPMYTQPMQAQPMQVQQRKTQQQTVQQSMQTKLMETQPMQVQQRQTQQQTMQQPMQTQPMHTLPMQVHQRQTPQQTMQHPMPMRTQPMQTQQMHTQPIQTQPMQAQPMQTQPMQTQPMQTQPMQTQPMQTQQMQMQPMQTQSMQTQPMQTQPMQTQPMQVQQRQTQQQTMQQRQQTIHQQQQQLHQLHQQQMRQQQNQQRQERERIHQQLMHDQNLQQQQQLQQWQHQVGMQQQMTMQQSSSTYEEFHGRDRFQQRLLMVEQRAMGEHYGQWPGQQSLAAPQWSPQITVSPPPCSSGSSSPSDSSSVTANTVAVCYEALGALKTMHPSTDQSDLQKACLESYRKLKLQGSVLNAESVALDAHVCLGAQSRNSMANQPCHVRSLPSLH